MRAVDTHFMDDLTLGHANEISLSDPLSWVRNNCTVEVHALTSMNLGNPVQYCSVEKSF